MCVSQVPEQQACAWAAAIAQCLGLPKGDGDPRYVQYVPSRAYGMCFCKLSSYSVRTDLSDTVFQNVPKSQLAAAN